eukprot:tig00000615_g2571.t1
MDDDDDLMLNFVSIPKAAPQKRSAPQRPAQQQQHKAAAPQSSALAKGPGDARRGPQSAQQGNRGPPAGRGAPQRPQRPPSNGEGRAAQPGSRPDAPPAGAGRGERPEAPKRGPPGAPGGPRKRAKGVIRFDAPQAPREEAAEVDVDAASSAVFSEADFASLRLDERMVKNLAEMGITRTTRIQQAALPAMLAGKDVLLKSETGSGKTVGYCIALVHSLSRMRPPVKREDGTYALVLAPTRELCAQILLTLTSLVKAHINIVPGSIMGGEKKKSEKARLRKGVSILVATPGRLLDHINTTASFEYGKLRWLVLDEADRLLDMGFEKDVRAIVHKLNEHAAESGVQRQSALVSATLKSGVERLASLSLRHPLRIGFDGPAGLPPAPPKAKGAGEEEDEDEDGSGAEGSGSEEEEGEGEGGGKKAAGAEEEASDRKRGDDDDAEFRIPERLRQQFLSVPAKQRLVALAALLRWKTSAAAEPAGEDEAKKKRKARSLISTPIRSNTFRLRLTSAQVIVFFSTCDSVEFHHGLLQGLRLPAAGDWIEREGTGNAPLPEAPDPAAPARVRPPPAALCAAPDEARRQRRGRGGRAKEALDSDDEGGGSGSDASGSDAGGSGSGSGSGEEDEEEDEEEGSSSGGEGGPGRKAKKKKGRGKGGPPPVATAPLVACKLFKLHGNMGQLDRVKTFLEFCRADAAVLFCTDVAARGLDLPHVRLIVQYDTPGEVKEYVHRVGRTARAGKAGEAVLFLMPHEEDYAELLSRAGVNIRPLKLSAVLGTLSASAERGRAVRRKEERNALAAVALQHRLERAAADEPELHSLALSAYRSFLRAYSTHTAATRHIFKVKSLHLGHVAKSFALRDAPSQIARAGKKDRKLEKKQQGGRKVFQKGGSRGARGERSAKLQGGTGRPSKPYRIVGGKRVLVRGPGSVGPGNRSRAEASGPPRPGAMPGKRKLLAAQRSEFDVGTPAKRPKP